MVVPWIHKWLPHLPDTLQATFLLQTSFCCNPSQKFSFTKHHCPLNITQYLSFIFYYRYVSFSLALYCCLKQLSTPEAPPSLHSCLMNPKCDILFFTGRHKGSCKPLLWDELENTKGSKPFPPASPNTLNSTHCTLQSHCLHSAINNSTNQI